ncbi:PRC-barrel domain-containing protein [Halomonas sp. LBP4]|uniref:PRC-barrel domain-containing protein n=1 Tax=Halomonas sp. LBP4 TaxID=2044917 RepID=UPI0015E8D767|nr:PRC-barrel domain-containing protein [Halomonas sp. LBP4]
MKKLTALILSAAIVPALALSTAAMAEDHVEMQPDTKQHVDEQRTGEQQMSGKPAGAFYADDVIGNTVKHRSSDEDVGKIQDLIIGEDGRIVGVVVKTGGFLGLGGQDIGLGWDHIEHTMEDDESVFYTDNIDEETLRSSPKYERD